MADYCARSCEMKLFPHGILLHAETKMISFKALMKWKFKLLGLSGTSLEFLIRNIYNNKWLITVFKHILCTFEDPGNLLLLAMSYLPDSGRLYRLTGLHPDMKNVNISSMTKPKGKMFLANY